MNQIRFKNDAGDFSLSQPENISALYFPLASETGLKSAITPNLGGDAKLNQDTFLLEPVSVDDLHNNRSTRNVWIRHQDGSVYSIAGNSAEQESQQFTPQQESSTLTAGFMWHSLERIANNIPIRSTATSFIPYQENVEILSVTIENLSDSPQEVTAYAAIPLFGRSADNIRDHRHVTSLLHRISVTKEGVRVCPTMSFDERGHQLNHHSYYVFGFDELGQPPQAFYPTVDAFIGEGGSFTKPRAVYEAREGKTAPFTIDGREAMGAFRFETVTLAPGASKQFTILLGVSDQESELTRIAQTYRTAESVKASLEETKNYWKNKVNVAMTTGNPEFDRLMKWVCFQPFLRRLFGCSFLPHHDYGRGGRGWRDLWQDCLSLLLMEPDNVGHMIINNFKGVRLDGTNATIIGSGEGEFIADRNGISRVWMDHALWPLITTKLYVDQTGDINLLTKEVSYFKDPQIKRGQDYDKRWTEAYGNQQLSADGSVYVGSILEHLLIQHLTGFYEVGAHNIYRLRGADWNDALDMAEEHGESVAFTAAFSGNLMELAGLIRLLESKGQIESVEILEEVGLLLKKDADIYHNVSRKQQILDLYTNQCTHYTNGRKISMPLSEIAINLIQKATWLRQHLQQQEWVSINKEEGWYNSYYDNSGQATDGKKDDHINMMLTGQVFSIMNYVATDQQIRQIITSADRHLYHPEIGGYQLNTNFHELKTDLGRMFGFAYGEKENGAVFSHMSVMYANALYRRGFAKEGWKVLKALADTALDFSISHIYPGIPEYFRSDGRGLYHYLTGSASWFMLTMVSEVFGVQGKAGDLTFHPKLLAEHFDNQNQATIQVPFAGKTFCITYHNPKRKDYGDYIITQASYDGIPLAITDDSFALLTNEALTQLDNSLHTISILLD